MFQWNPSDYEKNSSAQERAAEAILSRLEFGGNEHILDIGCGDGKVTIKMASLVPQGQVLGIDSSFEMIDFARTRFPSPRYSNLRFEQGDAQNLSYDQKFDLVTSFACLHWVKDHLAVLRGIKRSLRPGGRMIIQCGGRGTDDDIFALTREIIRSDRWSEYFRGYSNPHGIYGPEEYHAWLAQVGLEEVKVMLTVKDMVLPGKVGLDGFIRTTWLSVIERIPVEMRPQFISEVSDRYLERRPIEDGKALVGMAVLEAEARRID
ncbi:MAG TPA: methyltransferase domain-containing protein [Methanotrichaceae archaeon]|nr:methyltransferase domain-containing protein [Methanotrichaceae archaeon]